MTTPVLPLAATQPAAELVADHDLSMFRVMHQAMRAHVRSLGVALRLLDPDDRRAPHELADWFANVLTVIEHHHVAEDTTFFPLLVDADPEAAALVAAMAADHHELDRHLQAVATSLDALVRAGANAPAERQRRRAVDAVAGLVACLDDHLDREEAMTFPVFRRSVTRDAYAAAEARVHEEGDKKLFAFVAPWVLATASPEQADRLFGQVPRIVRILFRFVWRPRYEAAYPNLVAGLERVQLEQGALAA